MDFLSVYTLGSKLLHLPSLLRRPRGREARQVFRPYNFFFSFFISLSPNREHFLQYLPYSLSCIKGRLLICNWSSVSRRRVAVAFLSNTGGKYITCIYNEDKPLTDTNKLVCHQNGWLAGWLAGWLGGLISRWENTVVAAAAAAAAA